MPSYFVNVLFTLQSHNPQPKLERKINMKETNEIKATTVTKSTTPDRLTKEERETTIVFSEIDNCWVADTSVQKHKTRFIKQGWELTSETTLPDGTWVASTFSAPPHAISIRNSVKAVREISEEQRLAASERFRKIRE